MEDAKNISKTYDPKEFEERIYKWWLDSGFFTPKVDKKKKHYTIIMPPPNITGKLHMGHALNVTIQDVLIRFKRMQGYSTLYLPGEDHASIATEVKVEKELLKKGIKKRDIGREEFLKKVWEWTDEYRNKIRTQVQKMGCSADFTRERFTMDENVSKAVRAVFVKLFNEGLIYQGNRLINWCPKCMTALSDAEIEYEEKPGNFYHVKYPIYGEEGKFIEVATTRPETMFGDAAVAVNPKDERYKDIVGKTLILPLTDRKIPVISDYYVDMEFGTGIVKITPAHDPNDYEVGKRHDLPEINILNGNGTLNENCGKYQGMDRYDARKKVIEDLKKLGLLVKVEERTHNVGCHDRCGTIVEPIISKQWFVKMDTLAKPALKVVREGKVKFIPERFEKIYDHWLSNIRDWCISRQLWWGHRIPVWYCDDCGAIMASETDLKECSKCGSKNIRQDEDVLDTWFSSALWPFSTLGWPDKTEDLKYFYPTNTLVTAADIIPFWVVRMVFSSLHNMDEIPFDTVYINSLVRDSLGRKMSKSLGNGIDPLDVINKYGTDALRHMLVTGNAPGNDIRFREEKIESSRNFANKIWNASRFVMMNLDEEIMNKYKDCNDYSLADKWIVSRLNTTVKEVTENLDRFEIGIASTKIYDFIWTEFCDYYIEFAKVSIYGDDEKAKGVTLNVLKHVLSESLKLLHPIMPFITEEIYTHLDNEYKSISISKWPEYEDSLHDEKAEKEVSYIIEAIKGIRNARLSMNVPFSRKAKMLVFVTEQDCRKAYESGTSYFEKMASVSSVEYIDKKSEDKNNVSVVTKGAEIYIPLTDLIDIDKEIERLKKEEEKLQGEIKRCTGKLSNEKFTSKAPEAIVNAEREKLKKYQEMYDSVASRIKGLKK